MSLLTPKKLFIINNSEATDSLIISLQKFGSDFALEYSIMSLYDHAAGENPEVRSLDKVFTAQTMQDFLASDAIVLFGTWGSSHPDRAADKIGQNRQSAVENVNRLFVAMAREYSKSVVVLETATLSRIRYNYLGDEFKNTAKGLYPRYIRISRDHWTWNKGRWLSTQYRNQNRIKLFRKIFKSQYDIEIPIFEHQWRNDPDGDVLICAGLEHDPTSSMPVKDWITETVKKVSALTTRTIRIRLHPLSLLQPDLKHLINDRVKFDNSTVRLRHSVKNVYCAVLDSSTSVFELIDLGIPVITGDNSFGRELGNTDIDKIEDLNYADPGKIAVWYNTMAWTEFHQVELSDGTILPFLRELIDG